MLLRFRWFPSQACPVHLVHRVILDHLGPWWVCLLIPQLLLASIQVVASVLTVSQCVSGVAGNTWPEGETVRPGTDSIWGFEEFATQWFLCSAAGWTWIWSQRRQGGHWGSRTTSKWSWVIIDRTGLSCMSHWCWSPQTAGSTRLPRLAGVCGACGSSRGKGREGKLEEGLGVNLSMLLMKHLWFVLFCVSRADLENLDSMWVCHQ